MKKSSGDIGQLQEDSRQTNEARNMKMSNEDTGQSHDFRNHSQT